MSVQRHIPSWEDMALDNISTIVFPRNRNGYPVLLVKIGAQHSATLLFTFSLLLSCALGSYSRELILQRNNHKIKIWH